MLFDLVVLHLRLVNLVFQHPPDRWLRQEHPGHHQQVHQERYETTQILQQRDLLDVLRAQHFEPSFVTHASCCRTEPHLRTADRGDQTQVLVNCVAFMGIHH